MLEFGLFSIGDAGRLLGRCGDRDIPIGTVFTTVRRHRFHRDELGVRSEDAEVVGEICLMLCEVHWYERSIDAIPRGHSAALVVSGEGTELLAQLLRSLQPHEVLSLEAAEGR